MKSHSILSPADKKLLFWFGMILVVFASIAARLIMGTWWGVLFGVGYIILWLSPIMAGFAEMSIEKEKDELEDKIVQKDEEIAQLKTKLDSYQTSKIVN